MGLFEGYFFGGEFLGGFRGDYGDYGYDNWSSIVYERVFGVVGGWWVVSMVEEIDN